MMIKMKKETADELYIPESWDKITRIDVKSKKVLISYMKNNVLYHRIYLLSEDFSYDSKLNKIPILKNKK